MKYKTRKDRRKNKTGAKSVCHSCRNNGTCRYCTTSRLYKNLKREKSSLYQLSQLDLTYSIT